MASVETEMHKALTFVSESSRSDLLIRLLAQARLELAHERTFNNIFESQMVALRRISKNGGSEPKQTAISDYEFIQDLYPEQHGKRSFEAWLGYLKASGLVTETEDRIALTEMGSDFLMFIEAKYPAVKRPI
jgi:hypothetical protein